MSSPRSRTCWTRSIKKKGRREYQNGFFSRVSRCDYRGLFQTDLYDAHFDASWEIDVFGGKRRALQQANALLASVEEDRRDVLVSVLAEVARNYVEVRNFQQRLAIAHKNIKAQQDAVDIARSRFSAGLSSELDAKQAEALLATTQAQVPLLETSLKHGLHRLGVLIGGEPGTLLVELSQTAISRGL